MELVSEMIAIDDAAKKLVTDARAKADELKVKAEEDIAGLKEENARKLAELKEKSREKAEAAKEAAAKESQKYESEQKAKLDEYFGAHGEQLADTIVNAVYNV